MNALEFATRAHKGVFRWDKVTPYIEHPKAVVALLESFKVVDEDIINAAYLHDVLEDTKASAGDITKFFGKRCCSLVEELTRPEDADYFEHCSEMSKDASLIKVADILCNLTDVTSPKSQNFIQKRLKALTMLQDKV